MEEFLLSRSWASGSLAVFIVQICWAWVPSWWQLILTALFDCPFLSVSIVCLIIYLDELRLWILCDR